MSDFESLQTQKLNLVEILLECPSFSTSADRKLLLNYLSDAFRQHIRLGATFSDREEALAIVNCAISFPGGLEELLETLKFLDNGTLGIAKIETFIKNTENKLLQASYRASFIPYNLPQRDPRFVGREKELEQIYNTLTKKQRTNIVTLLGSAGIGKTSLAIEYIYRYRELYNLIIWLSGNDTSVLTQNYSELSILLGITQLPDNPEKSQEQIVRMVNQKLSRHKENSKQKEWLLVFDNFEKLEDVQAFLPIIEDEKEFGVGHFIITSRNKHLNILGTPIIINGLLEEEALQLIKRYSKNEILANEKEERAAKVLINKLDCSPVAIVFASSSIRSNNTSISNYLASLEHQEINGNSIVSYILETVLKRISESSPTAINLLNLLAFFASDNINLDWFSANNLKNNLADVFNAFQENNTVLETSISLLQEQSLLTKDGKFISVHTLIQTALRNRLANIDAKLNIKNKKGQIFWLNKTVTFLLTVFPDSDNYKNWESCEEFIPHIQGVLNYCEQVSDAKNNSSYIENSLDLAQISSLYWIIGSYFYKRDLNTKAKFLLERSLALKEKTNGEDSAEFAAILNNLALILHTMGDYESAKPLLERALIIREKLFGNDHSHVANSLNNLGALLKDTGEYDAAKDRLIRALSIAEKAADINQVEIALILDNLAQVMQAIGKFVEAEFFYKKALYLRQHTLGSEHPDIAITLSNLAELSRAIGEYSEAKSYYEQALAIREKTFGIKHPDVATTFNNLGAFLKDTGDYEEAKKYYEQALAIREELFGTEHPDVANTLSNLGELLRVMGNNETAKQMLEKALSIRKRTLGIEHSEYTITLNNLALVFQDTGNFEAAKPLFEQALLINEKIFGANHTLVANSHNNLASLLHDLKEYTEARTHYEQALRIWQETLGSNHPKVASCLNNMGILLKDQGNIVEGLSYLKNAFSIFQTTLGDNHPNTLHVAESLSRLESSL